VTFTFPKTDPLFEITGSTELYSPQQIADSVRTLDSAMLGLPDSIQRQSCVPHRPANVTKSDNTTASDSTGSCSGLCCGTRLKGTEIFHDFPQSFQVVIVNIDGVKLSL
jgi:hypothetical protein